MLYCLLDADKGRESYCHILIWGLGLSSGLLMLRAYLVHSHTLPNFAHVDFATLYLLNYDKYKRCR